MSLEDEDTKRARRASVGAADPITASDRRLLEHVLEGQRALQVAVSDLHCVVADRFGDLKGDFVRVAGEMAHASKMCEQRILQLEHSERDRARDFDAHRARSHKRIRRLESYVIAIGGGVAVLGAVLAASWAVYGDVIKRAVGG